MKNKLKKVYFVKIKYDNIWNYPFLFAFLFTLFVWIIFMCTSPQLSTAGDRNIAELLMSPGKIKVGFFFISPLLADLLRLLNQVYPANWWSVFSVLTMFTGMYIFLWFLNKRLMKYDWTIRIVMSGLFSLFFWELMLRYDINFTQTAVIASLSGFLLFINFCFTPMGRTNQIIQIIIGVLLLFLAGAVRWKALVLTLPFEVMAVVYLFLFPYQSESIVKSVQASLKGKSKYIIMTAALVLIVLSSYAIHKIYGVINPELGEYVEANKLREDICDYVDRYPDYTENQDVYEGLGIRESWITMVNNFYTSDVNYFSSDDLHKMVDLRGASAKTVKEFMDTLKGHSVLWFVFLFMILGNVILRGWKNCFFPLLGCVFAFILCALYFVGIGRFAWRVTDGCILGGAIAFIVMSSHPIVEQKEPFVNLCVKTGMLALAALFLIIGAAAVKSEKGSISKPTAGVNNSRQAAILDYMNNHKENVYFSIDNFRFVDAYNLWSTHEPDYLDNYFMFKAHFLMGCTEKLEEYGITDVYRDMLDKESVRVMYSKAATSIVYDYLYDYYDPCISISVVEEFGGTQFIRYSSPIIPDYLNESDIKSSIGLLDKFSEDKTVYKTFKVESEIDNILISNYEVFYFNITDLETKDVYTYSMTVDKNKAEAEVLCMNDTWNPESIKAVLLGRTYDGKIEQLADLTEAFYTNYDF